MTDPWVLRIDGAMLETLMNHLYGNAYGEHGAVLAAGWVMTSRGTRLLARELFLAEDEVDYVPGRRGYRMLTASFVNEKIRYCRDEKLAYLAIHNHAGRDFVEFSSDDMRSHERGYPALLDIADVPVGALVFAENAVAGDIWTPDGRRRPLAQMDIVGHNIATWYPSPPPKPPKAEITFDRQARWLGDRGQFLLSQLKVGVIGAGGVGLPLITMLARVGVGEIVVIDPDRFDPSNLPRLDVHHWYSMKTLRQRLRLESIANRLSPRKTFLARRAVRRASRRTVFTGIPMNVIEPEAAHSLIDTDFLFLAADSHQARMVFNAIVHQFLIPGLQIGTKIPVDQDTGDVGDIDSNIRRVLPSQGCLRCNGLISPTKLQDESLDPMERERNRYIDEVPAPSVITFNTFAAAQAANDFLLMFGEFLDPDADGYLRARPRQRKMEKVSPLPNKADCKDCGSISRGRRARGQGIELPLPQR
jgi:molybdopterin/thiamine biosynthesis adenylyltransferase